MDQKELLDKIRHSAEHRSSGSNGTGSGRRNSAWDAEGAGQCHRSTASDNAGTDGRSRYRRDDSR